MIYERPYQVLNSRLLSHSLPTLSFQILSFLLETKTFQIVVLHAVDSHSTADGVDVIRLPQVLNNVCNKNS